MADPKHTFPCTVEHCVEMTQHRSGVCVVHRSFKCQSCGKTYVTPDHFTRGIETKLCVRCREIKRARKAAGYGEKV